jgi:hypothetical protein
MNKVKAVIESLKKDMENIDIEEIVALYEKLEPVHSIAEKIGRNHYEVQKVLLALQLRRKKKHRLEDAHTLKLQLMDAKGDTDTLKVVKEMSQEIDYLHSCLDSKETAFNRANFELKRLRRDAKHTSMIETLESDVLEAFTDYCNNSHLHVYEKIFVPINTSKQDIPENGLVAIYGDTHYGEVVSKKEVPSNEYNYAIARARLEKFVDNVLMFPRQSSNLVLVDLKDTIKGVIHGGIYTSEGSFIASIMQAVDFNVFLYSTLASVYDNVTVVTTGSNHERTQDTIIADKKFLDYGRLIDGFVSIQLKALGVNNVTISTTDCGYNMFYVNEAPIVAFHGDTLRKFNPVDGNQRALLQDVCVSELRETYKHSINGHGHQFIMAHNQYSGVSIQNGTLVGANEYGLQSGFRSITPSQTICFVESDGNIQDVRAVDLTNIDGYVDEIDERETYQK